jgi:hypothetical protein
MRRAFAAPQLIARSAQTETDFACRGDMALTIASSRSHDLRFSREYHY